MALSGFRTKTNKLFQEDNSCNVQALATFSYNFNKSHIIINVVFSGVFRDGWRRKGDLWSSVQIRHRKVPETLGGISSHDSKGGVYTRKLGQNGSYMPVSIVYLSVCLSVKYYLWMLNDFKIKWFQMFPFLVTRIWQLLLEAICLSVMKNIQNCKKIVVRNWHHK